LLRILIQIKFKPTTYSCLLLSSTHVQNINFFYIRGCCVAETKYSCSVKSVCGNRMTLHKHHHNGEQFAPHMAWDLLVALIIPRRETLPKGLTKGAVPRFWVVVKSVK
jgi:hypothetical protein